MNTLCEKSTPKTRAAARRKSASKSPVLDALLAMGKRGQQVKWQAHWKLEKFNNAKNHKDTIGQTPDEVVSVKGNLLLYAGASALWQCLIGNGTGTAAQSLTFFNNGNAAIGVGDSSTSAAATQTNLQASSNRLRVGMVSTYPQHTPGTTSGAATITFQSSFSTGQANYAWNECGIFNSTIADGSVGSPLNRLVQSFGTKSAGVWTLTLTVTLS